MSVNENESDNFWNNIRIIIEKVNVEKVSFISLINAFEEMQYNQNTINIMRDFYDTLDDTLDDSEKAKKADCIISKGGGTEAKREMYIKEIDKIIISKKNKKKQRQERRNDMSKEQHSSTALTMWKEPETKTNGRGLAVVEHVDQVEKARHIFTGLNLMVDQTIPNRIPLSDSVKLFLQITQDGLMGLMSLSSEDGNNGTEMKKKFLKQFSDQIKERIIQIQEDMALEEKTFREFEQRYVNKHYAHERHSKVLEGFFVTGVCLIPLYLTYIYKETLKKALLLERKDYPICGDTQGSVQKVLCDAKIMALGLWNEGIRPGFNLFSTLSVESYGYILQMIVLIVILIVGTVCLAYFNVKRRPRAPATKFNTMNKYQTEFHKKKINLQRNMDQLRMMMIGMTTLKINSNSK